MPDERKILRLSSITTRLGELLLPATVPQFWVRAQFITDKSARTGHCYGTLVEIDSRGQERAKLRAVIWRDDFQRIEKTLRDAGSADVLREGGEICALCSVRWHTVHGLSLTIFDVDPFMGESHVERQRRVVLERLQREDLIGRNKTRTVTVAPLRIGLVTADGSAALADFRQTLIMSEFGFRILLAPAAMQGDAAAPSVVRAIEHLSTLELDLICIVRGGGSPSDLAWLDHETIARAVAHCPHPVWVGIGHEIDHGVLDVVAHTSHKTPTAVAKELVERLATLAARLESGKERLQEACERRLALAERHLEQASSSLAQDARKHFERSSSRFAAATDRMRGLARRITEQAAIKLGHAKETLLDAISSQHQDAVELMARSRVGLIAGSRKLQELQEERHRRRVQSVQDAIDRVVARHRGRLEGAATKLRERLRAAHDRNGQALKFRAARLTRGQLERRVDLTAAGLGEKAKRLEALDPKRLLARGYSVVRDEAGKIVTSVADLSAGQTIRTQMQDGIVASIVDKVESND